MTHFDDDQLATWLGQGPQQAPAGAAEEALRHAHGVSQRPGWLVRMSGETLAADRTAGVLRFAVVLAVVAALTAVTLGAMLAGGIIKPFPAPSILAIESGSPRPQETSTPEPTPPTRTGLVANTVVTRPSPGEDGCPASRLTNCILPRVWVASFDGSNARELIPDAGDNQWAVAWTPDGSRLLVETGAGLKLATLSGKLEPVSTTSLCDYPCVPDLPVGAGAFSPDGNRFAFTRQYPDTDNGTVITILNLRTGNIRELASTYATNPPPGVQCNHVSTCEGAADAPAWSPDGRQLVFDRQLMSPENDSQWTGAAVYVVDADGSNLHRITPPGFVAIDPSWSPDGSRIVFINSPWGVSGDGTQATDPTADIYTVRPDGTDLQRLTHDGISSRPDWTIAGRIVFDRNVDTDSPEAWIMDADGSHQARILGNVLAELGAAGCRACMYPLASQGGGPLDALWQPVPN